MTQRRVLEAEVVPAANGVPRGVERDAIHSQMERILANPLFKHSKRYPLLFRYVVEQALEGHASQLKERTLGVEVFGRDPDYDTNLDPVVRVTAGEIRKRIAQYYHEAGHENELRIDLPCGSYVPEFHLSVHPAPRSRFTQSPFTKVRAFLASPARRVAALVGAAAALTLMVVVWRLPGSPLERFWGPVWDSQGSALLCIGGAGIAQDASAVPSPNNLEISVTGQIHREYVAFSDAATFSRLAGLFQARGKPYSMRIGAQTTFADLRGGPVVLVGGFNNWWTMRLLSQLRYSFGRDPATHLEWIEDRQNPLQRDWKVDTTLPYLKLTEDFAIISRVLDPATERMVVVVAGLVQYGTLAAGEFLTNSAYLEELSKRAPRNWRRQNLQAVIATRVIDGHSGPPRLVATYFW